MNPLKRSANINESNTKKNKKDTNLINSEENIPIVYKRFK
jgi:hypothetical protein